MEAFGTSEQNMWVDASSLGESNDHCYRSHFSHILLKRLQGNDLSDNSEIHREQKRRCDQARLGSQLKILDKQRLLGVPSGKENSSDKMSWEGIMWKESGVSAPLELQMEEEHRVIRLSDVTILPKVEGQGGNSIAGTLEAHVNGFKYTASGFHMQFYFDNIKKSFFRFGDKRMPPLLHFHLHHSIMIGTEKTKDIEFHFVQWPLGQKMSDKIEKEKQIKDGGHNEDLKNFVDKVNARWSSQPSSPFSFEVLEKEREFYGVLPSKASAAVALTLYYLLVLTEAPFVVIPLREIEIVNLALLRPGVIDMTVIFQDFKEESVIEINSIPLESLAGIKHRLNTRSVKYYVNAEGHDWKAILRGIADSPEKFIEKGGWDYFKLEDRDTLACYKEVAFDP
ncbi:hypothetical protein MKW94_009840 [Papaver nudicaule]|uniref:FACT complex subunit n=1 Tax=Papaver nudicaule TaxID=74823 RepID=A0AA41SDM5_PAPNU|nr:hypothetical protein [Papaver nudicaule]